MESGYGSVAVPIERNPLLLLVERAVRTSAITQDESAIAAAEDGDGDGDSDGDVAGGGSPPVTPLKKGKEKESSSSSSRTPKGKSPSSSSSASASSTPGDDTLARQNPLVPKFLLTSVAKCYPDPQISDVAHRDFDIVVPAAFFPARSQQPDLAAFRKRVEQFGSIFDVPEDAGQSFPQARALSEVAAEVAKSLAPHFQSLQESELLRLKVIQQAREAFRRKADFVGSSIKSPELQRLGIWATVCGSLEGDDFWLNVGLFHFPPYPRCDQNYLVVVERNRTTRRLSPCLTKDTTRPLELTGITRFLSSWQAFRGWANPCFPTPWPSWPPLDAPAKMRRGTGTSLSRGS